MATEGDIRFDTAEWEEFQAYKRFKEQGGKIGQRQSRFPGGPGEAVNEWYELESRYNDLVEEAADLKTRLIDLGNEIYNEFGIDVSGGKTVISPPATKRGPARKARPIVEEYFDDDEDEEEEAPPPPPRRRRRSDDTGRTFVGEDGKPFKGASYIAPSQKPLGEVPGETLPDETAVPDAMADYLTVKTGPINTNVKGDSEADFARRVSAGYLQAMKALQ